MKTKLITSIILIVSLSIWAFWDIIVATNAIKEDTISEITLSVAYISLFIPAAWGIIMGHLFWPMRKVTYKWTKIHILWGWGAIILLISLGGWIPATEVTIPVIFLIHFVIGHYLWPQQAKNISSINN